MIKASAQAAGAHAMTTLDTEKHAWCPTCKARPGSPCRVTKAATRRVLANDHSAGPWALHVDHDGETLAHMSRINRADLLAAGEADDLPAPEGGWRRDELYAVVRGRIFHREGKAP